MSLITDLTRMYLTHSTKPFVFTNDFDKVLPYDEEAEFGLYVHIPFCKSICNFCPYCKVIYDEKTANVYIDALIKEIHLVGKQWNGRRKATSLYFGGGTPALLADRITDIIAALSEHFIITDGIGIELHPDNVNVSVLKTLKRVGVDKISIGVQSFQDKYQKVLQRRKFDIKDMSNALNEVEFETVSMDFIFALPTQTFEDLKNDIDMAFANGANHIAIYPLIDFTFTENKVPIMPKKEKRKLLDDITNYCISKGYVRKSIWTFASDKSASYSSMTRDNFFGFGCSATSLFKDQFKINTFSVLEYCKRIDANILPTALTNRFVKRQRMVYYLFWKLYSTRLKVEEFGEFFDTPLNKVYGLEFWLLQMLGFLTRDEEGYKMTLKGAFYYHYYENFYTLSYIDKMWGIMRKEAFPKDIKL
ncbi:radical SAM protein [Lachnoanaerobaculum sp. Marseille-Q4761]|uniref:coproporphyrinogen-III oxidase family protein n=1 Tax=Lachnoanaerobaculum sp. Marseille-Q4761 TaxID=2819511 RepID=UPI001AA119A3|nr:radical SAM protein [Lachnoanaerobaculum sp. Marseille-Q4761]MBO1870988.1 radical SAM protein [Lachnoanaerobaculum sp. Marseille-Q4761]